MPLNPLQKIRNRGRSHRANRIRCRLKPGSTWSAHQTSKPAIKQSSLIGRHLDRARSRLRGATDRRFESGRRYQSKQQETEISSHQAIMADRPPAAKGQKRRRCGPICAPCRSVVTWFRLANVRLKNGKILTTSTASAGPKPKDAHAVDAPSRRDPGSGSVAAVPGSRRLRRCRRRAAPGTLEPDRERGLEDRHPRTRLELAGRLGRPDLRHVRDPAGRAGETAHRHLSRRPSRQPAAGRAPLDGLLPRFQHRRNPLGARGPSQHAEERAAPQEQLCLRDAGH